MKPVALAAALLGAAAVAGCGGSSQPSAADARATVQRYFAAVASQRADAACAELSARSRQRLAEAAALVHAAGKGCPGTMRAVFGSAYGRRLARFAHPHITALKVSGSTATAVVEGVDKPLELRAASGSWGIEFAPSVGPD